MVLIGQWNGEIYAPKLGNKGTHQHPHYHWCGPFFIRGCQRCGHSLIAEHAFHSRPPPAQFDCLIKAWKVGPIDQLKVRNGKVAGETWMSILRNRKHDGYPSQPRGRVAVCRTTRISLLSQRFPRECSCSHAARYCLVVFSTTPVPLPSPRIPAATQFRQLFHLLKHWSTDLPKRLSSPAQQKRFPCQIVKCNYP